MKDVEKEEGGEESGRERGERGEKEKHIDLIYRF